MSSDSAGEGERISKEEEDDVTQEEIQQVQTSKIEIGKGQARRFKNAEEYLKDLDDDIPKHDAGKDVEREMGF